MVLHSEQRKRPALTALSFLEQMGQAKILGKIVVFWPSLLVEELDGILEVVL
jgi:hypothetical protein